jgi:hypothetical protein
MTMPTKVDKIGEVAFTELPGDIQSDVRASVAHLTGEDEEDVKIGLENGPAMLPLVEVDPESIFDPNRAVSELAVESYVAALVAGVGMPPVVVDSSKDPAAALMEGGHRTAAAVEARLKKIVAVDVAQPRVIKTEEGLETYSFRLSRHGRSRKTMGHRRAQR